MAQELLIIFWQREQKSLIQNMFSNAKICSNTVQVVTTIRKDMSAVIISMAEVVTTSAPLKQKAFPKHGRLFILVP